MTLPPKQTDFLANLEELTKEMGFHGQPVSVKQKSKKQLSREVLMSIDIMLGNVNNVRQYLMLGADPNFKIKNRSLLELANAHNYPEIAELLKEYGAKASKKLSNRPT